MNETNETAESPGDPGREELLKQTAAPAPKKKKRWLLRIAIGLPGLLALLVLAAPTIASMGFVRRKIEAAAEEATGRKVTIGDHSVGWFGPVTVSDVVMYEKDGTTPFFKLEKASVDVAFRPLAGGNVVLRTAEISGVNVTIVKRRDGTLSTDDIGEEKPGAPRKKTEEKKSGGDSGTFSMGTIKVRDVNVTYIDEAANTTTKVLGLTVDAKPGATADEIAADVATKVQVGNASPGELKVKAVLLALQAGKPRSEITGDATVSFSGVDVASMQPMEGVDWKTGAVGGTVKAKLLAGGDVEASLDVNVPSFRWGAPGAVPLVETPVVVRQDVSWTKKTGRVEVKPNGRIEKKGCWDVQAQGSLDLATGADDRDNPIDIVATFNADLARMREVLPSSLAEQDIKTTLYSTWSVKGPDLDHLAITGRGSLTCPPIPTDYTYRTRDKDGKATDYAITNPGQLTLDVKCTYDGQRRKERAEREPGRAWASLDGVGLDVRIDTPWVRSPGADLKQVLVELSLREQQCEIRHLDFRLNDGPVTCTGTMTFDAEDPAWTLHTTADNPPVKYSSQFSSLAALLNPALYSEEKGQVEAAMAWKIALRARGFSMDSIKKTVEGEGSLGLRNVTIAGSTLFNELYSKLQLTKESKLSYSLVDQKFHVKGGKVYNEFTNWTGEDKAADITITGETDFDGNLKQTILVSGDPNARWGTRTGAVVEVFNKAGGLPLGGTVDSPKIDIDFEKALKGIAQGLLDNPEVKEKVQDAINDIFKKKKKK